MVDPDPLALLWTVGEQSVLGCDPSILLGNLQVSEGHQPSSHLPHSPVNNMETRTTA